MTYRDVCDQVSRLAAVLAFLASILPVVAIAGEAFPDNSFVTVKNGHLQRDGQRLRVWGVNLQSGVFKTYAEIDALISRLGALGFNAIRLWPTSGTFYRIGAGSHPTFNASSRGDGSDLDRFDYLVAVASRHGINIQMPMLHYFDLPMLKASLEPAIAEMVSASADDAMLRRVHGFAPYVSPGYRDRLKLHMRRVLTRKNPYTDRRYADEPAVSTWELANEANFVHCAIDPQCLKMLPPIVLSYLDSAWRASPQNPKKVSLPSKLEAIGDPVFFANYSRFIVEQFIGISNELREHARDIGGEGSGVSVQPFIFNTDPGERTAVSHYAYSAGDVFSVSAYASPLAPSNGYQGSPWIPYVAGGKSIPFLEYVKVKDKPFVVYEASFFRPYPFRAEWGIVMAAIALRQDWDGAFLYSYGQPGVIYERIGDGAHYGTKVLPNPVPGDVGERGHYAYGFHHGGDPIAMASWSVGGRLFLAAPSTHDDPEIVWDIPLEHAFKLGAGYPVDFLSPPNIAVAPRRKSMAVRFTSRSAACAPCKAKVSQSGEVITAWDTSAKRLTVQTAGGRAVVGELSGDLGSIAPGIAIQTLAAGFGAVAVLSEVRGKDTQLQVIGNVENSGAIFNSGLVDFRGPAGAMAGMIERGTAPLNKSGPDIRFLFSDPQPRYFELDFNLKQIGLGYRSNHYDFSSSGKVFQVNIAN